MPNKRVSDKEIVLSSSAPARHKPVTSKRAKRATATSESAPVTEVMPDARPQDPPTQDEIAALAYSYWEARGRHGGSAEEDWLRAEQELSVQRTVTATA